MRPVRTILAIFVAGLGLAGCGADYSGEPTFVAKLTPEGAVPPTQSQASGEARFYLSESGDALRYEIEVQDLPNVRTAQLKLAEPYKAGDPVYGLYTASPTSPEFTGRFSGQLTDGTIDPTLFTGKLAGLGVEALIEQIRSGGIYVTVETEQHSTGELRGKVQPRRKGTV